MFEKNDNRNTASGKYFTTVSDFREFGEGLVAFSYFQADMAAGSLEDADKAGIPAILVLTDTYYSGEDVSGIDLRTE